MKKKIKWICERLKSGRFKQLWIQTVWIYSYVRMYWKEIVFYTGTGLLGTIIGLVSSLLSKDLVDLITGHQASRLVMTFVWYIAFSAGNICVTQLLNYLSNMISLKVDQEMKADIFQKMLTTRLEPLMAYHTGDLLTRWSSDVSVISSGVLNWIPNLIIYTAKFITSFAVVFYYDVTFALLALIGIPVSIVMSKTLLSKMQANNKQSAAMNAKMSGFHQETFSNIQAIKAFDLIPLYVCRLQELQKDYFSMKKKFQKLSAMTSIMMSFVGIVVSYSCYALGIYRVFTGAITYGTMTLFLSLSGSLTSTLNALIAMVPTAVSITTSAGRLMDILDMPHEDFSERKQAEVFYKKNKRAGIGVCMENVSYAYHTGKRVLTDVDFWAEPGQLTGLVGASGGGKTTMLRLLLSLLEPQQGTMKLYAGDAGHDGNSQFQKDSQTFPLSPATRQLYAYVPQGNAMFSGTIADNMRSVKPDATDKEIIDCLKKACAWEFIGQLPDTIYEKIGERGNNFSEGQAQRLSIARALLKNAPVLLLDEATSALDIETEKQVLKNIMEDSLPRTCIVTTHRPTALKLCKNVYAIQDTRCRQLLPEEIQKIIRDF